MIAGTEAKLHKVARKAALAGKDDDACACLNMAIERCGSSRSYLLCALLHSRLGNFEQCRDCFRQGICCHPKDAGLMQAWGLFESKHEQPKRALRLLQRAVALDPSLSGVLRWRRFQELQDAAACQCGCQDHAHSHPRRRRTAPVMALHAPAAPSAASPTVVEPPTVVWTVPEKYWTRGWRGRAELDEDPSKWYDAEGVRNGPPPNYWRQAMDERIHRNSLAALSAVVGGDFDDATLKQLESRMGLSKPLRNRKLLGEWAMLVTNGEVVATPAIKEGEGEGANAGFEVRAQLRVAREGARRTREHRYGTFDEHMEEGEALAVTLRSACGDEEAMAASVVTDATESNARRALPLTLPGGGAVHLGGVALLSEYLLIARGEGGELLECYMRIQSDEDLTRAKADD